ncbi:MAG: hypothetical protein Q4A62_04875 [Eikenella sp.]|nr:hypothetical protein [Eikenella sp.]
MMNTRLFVSLLALSAAAHGKTFEITGLPHGWQAEISVRDCTEAACRGPAVIRLSGNGFRQRFESADTDFAPPADGSNRLPYLHSPLTVGDFNFDGLPDVAVQNGNKGLYRSPSHDVYLQNTAKHFVFSQDFSDLTLLGMGLFQTDAARKVLITDARVGCCVHLQEEWAVLPDGKLQNIRRTTRDATTPGRLEITEETWENGRWQSRTRHETTTQ